LLIISFKKYNCILIFEILEIIYLKLEMSVNLIKSFLEGKPVKSLSFGFEFMERAHNFSLIKKLMLNNIQENK